MTKHLIMDPLILLLNQQVAQVAELNRLRAQRRRRRRRWWARPWIARRMELDIYDRLLIELRNEDTESFTNFNLEVGTR